MKIGLPFIFSEPIVGVAGVLGAAMGKEMSGSRARARGWLRFPGLVNICRLVRASTLWANATFTSKTEFRCYGNSYLNASRGFIRIGSNTHIDQFCVLYGQGGLTLGSDCAVASGVIIYTQTNQYAHDECCEDC